MKSVKALLSLPVMLLLILGNVGMASSSAQAIPTWQSYVSLMSHSSAPLGCYKSVYPSMVWMPTPCGIPVSTPMAGHLGGDNSESSGTSLIGYASGSFTSVTGLSTESDNASGTNYYSLQLNSNTWSCTISNNPTTCWQQFVYNNNGASSGKIFFVYALLGYHIHYTCPTGFSTVGLSCYKFSPGTTIPASYPAPSYLAKLSFFGTAAYQSSSNDQVKLCIQGVGCYTESQPDSVLNLSLGWKLDEFNVLGTGSGSVAKFNTGTSVTVWDSLQKGDGTAITPSCSSSASTLESNNLTLGSCSTSGGSITFTELNGYYLKMLVSGNGYVSPGSGYYRQGASVKIQAYPNPGCHTFTGWTGSYTGSDNPHTLTMSGNMTVTAHINNLCVPTR